jgi:hypothetical protein
VNRPGGIPPIFWLAGIVAGIGGFVWLRKRSSSSGAASPATAGKTGQPVFSQAQEVQDFQVFSSLTSAQQGSDLNFLTEVAGLLGGGSSTGTTSTPVSSTGSSGGGGSTGVPAPTSTGTTAPATVPASTVAAPAAPSPQSEPGYGAGIGQLVASNPGILQANSPGGPNISGITGYTASYNGVPL